MNKIPIWLRNKYLLATLLFFLYILLLDDNNLFYQYKLHKELKSLEQSSTNIKLKIKDLQKINVELEKSPLAIEKIAREKYGMKKSNETVFLVPEIEK